jgi:hypothetical protein
MNEEIFSLVQECTKYYVTDVDENTVEIFIQIPKKFKTLWLIKLSELRSSQTEINEYLDLE